MFSCKFAIGIPALNSSSKASQLHWWPDIWTEKEAFFSFSGESRPGTSPKCSVWHPFRRISFGFVTSSFYYHCYIILTHNLSDLIWTVPYPRRSWSPLPEGFINLHLFGLFFVFREVEDWTDSYRGLVRKESTGWDRRENNNHSPANRSIVWIFSPWLGEIKPTE